MNGLVETLLRSTTGVRAMRDATRGRMATVLNEIAKAADVEVLSGAHLRILLVQVA